MDVGGVYLPEFPGIVLASQVRGTCAAVKQVGHIVQVIGVIVEKDHVQSDRVRRVVRVPEFGDLADGLVQGE